MSAIKHYSTETPGVGGGIKRRIADFKVREVTTEGKVCEIKAFTSDEKLKLETEWPPLHADKEQVILTMEKFNLDTHDAVRRLTRFLRTSKKRVGFAGMKDKRAITSQKISIYKPDYNLLKKFDSRYLDLRDAEWADERIGLGDLKGNEFEITIRNVDLEKKEIEKRIKGCFKEMENGIANYFGEQRFGGSRNITHLVGKELLKGSFKEAVMLYLTSTFPDEEEEIKQARLNLAKTEDFSQAIKDFPHKFRYERAIIDHLCKSKNDFAGALGKLPKSLSYMFVHAYQSFLFNRVINKRIETGIGLGKIKEDILQDGFPTAPLFGFRTKFSEGRLGKIEKMILDEEGIELKNFEVKKMSMLSSKGSMKKIVLLPEKMKFLEVSKDEFNEGKYKSSVSFYLEKGNYATTVLRELMKDG